MGVAQDFLGPVAGRYIQHGDGFSGAGTDRENGIRCWRASAS